MLGSSEVIAFVATTNADLSRSFYESVLGLRLVADEPWAIVFDAGGTMLRVQKVRELAPAAHTTLGFKVSDIRAEMAELRERGVEFERYEGLTQDAHGVWTAPGGAMIAWFKDPDGNTLSLTELSR
jgi:catechol 2,3-dioxygenase-like lactoylglutathione lyase family enzyme